MGVLESLESLESLENLESLQNQKFFPKRPHICWDIC